MSPDLLLTVLQAIGAVLLAGMLVVIYCLARVSASADGGGGSE